MYIKNVYMFVIFLILFDIFNKKVIDRSNQDLLLNNSKVLPTIHLNNDRTIASCNITNNNELTLSIQ